MKRPHVHLLVDALLALGGLALVATGLLLEFVLPAHSRGATVWGLTRHDWGELHFWIALGLIALLLVHLALNWGWVCSVAGKLLGGGKPVAERRVAAGALTLGAFVGLVGGFLLAANTAVVDGPGERQGYGWRGGDGGGGPGPGGGYGRGPGRRQTGE